MRLVHNEDGTEVTGLIAKDSNTGEYHQYNGDAVVLACGDIGSNSAMYNAICRENYELGEYKDCAAMSGRDGSGIAMGMRIGAKVEIATGGDMGSHAFIPLSPMEGIECLWLNKYGERYCNEAFGGPLLSGCAGAREPGDRAYLIWGGDWKEVFLNQLAGHLAPKEWDAETVANMEATMEAAIGSGAEGDDTSGKFLYCADTLEELCDFMGMEEGVKANALAAVEKWNAAGDAGADTEFGRDPETMWPIKQGPFYGYPCGKRIGGGSLVATSGLLVTGRQQVQGQGFEPIKGLFACGNNSGGRFPMGYNGIMNGVSIGMCLCLGYTLGEFLATEDFDRYCTLGAGNADIKQSDKGMAGPAPARPNCYHRIHPARDAALPSPSRAKKTPSGHRVRRALHRGSARKREKPSPPKPTLSCRKPTCRHAYRAGRRRLGRLPWGRHLARGRRNRPTPWWTR